MMKVFIVVVIILVTFGCKSPQEKNREKWHNQVDSIVSQWQGREMILPTTLQVIDSNFSNQQFEKLYRSPLKMVTFIDGDCGTCTSNLENWSKFMRSLGRYDGKCDFVFYIQTDFPKNFQKNIYSKYKMSVPWILDSSAIFIQKNNLWDPRFQTALLDENNKVVFIGDMRGRPQLEDLYKQSIVNFSK